MFACLVWDFHTVVSYQCRNPVFEGSSWRLHSVNQGCGSGGAGIPHRSSHEHQDRDARSCHQKRRNAARMPPQSVRVKVCLQVSKQVNNDLSLTCAWTQESLFVTLSASELSSCGMLPASGGTSAPSGGMLAK